MSKDNYRTAPTQTDKMPGGIPYIIGNEAAERFSFYGMKAILVIFMTKYLVDSNGYQSTLSPGEAKTIYHMFTSAVYFTPIFGALLADYFLGKYKTILTLSVVYCLGHLTLALDETTLGLTVGLTLIAIGAGGIKPCVSAHVGDQFGKSNAGLLEKVFGWFYFSINLGAFSSSLMTPILLKYYGPSVAFGIPGGLMLIATWAFWLGRKKFIHIPAGGKDFVKEVFSKEGLKSVSSLFMIYIFVAMFWALFDQTGSAWVLQATHMDRNWLGVEWLPSQIQAINPILIMVFIPIFTFIIYPTLNKMFVLTPLKKISIGFFITVPAFLIPAWIESQIGAGLQPNIIWQLLSYAIITAAEVFVSITCLEFSYTQAPKKMKSFVMAFFMMSISLGNAFVAVVNYAIQEQTPVANVKAIGSQEVEPKRTTTYELACTGNKDPKGKQGKVSQQIRVAIQVPFKGKKAAQKAASKPTSKASATTKKAKKAYTGDPKILTWEANGKSGHSRVRPNTSVTLVWKAAGVEKCILEPGNISVGANGSKKVLVKETTVYTLSCATTGDKKIGSKLKIKVDSKVMIHSFQVNGKGTLMIPPPGKKIMLSWKASKAKSCRIIAHTNKLEGPWYYLFFAGLMFITAILFIFVAMNYKEATYIQDEEDAEPSA